MHHFLLIRDSYVFHKVMHMRWWSPSHTGAEAGAWRHNGAWTSSREWRLINIRDTGSEFMWMPTHTHTHYTLHRLTARAASDGGEFHLYIIRFGCYVGCECVCFSWTKRTGIIVLVLAKTSGWYCGGKHSSSFPTEVYSCVCNVCVRAHCVFMRVLLWFCDWWCIDCHISEISWWSRLFYIISLHLFSLCMCS